MAHRVGPQQLGLGQRRLVADDVGDGLLRVQVEQRRDAAELEREVHQDHLVGPLGDRRDRDVGRHGRRADAALGAVDGHRPACAGEGQSVGRDDRAEILRTLEAKEQGLDPGLHLACIEWPGHDVVRAGLEECDALLDIVGRADAHDRNGAHRWRGPDLPADLDGCRRPARRVDDDELVLGDLRVGLFGVGEHGHRIPGSRQDRLDRIARLLVRRDEQDGTGGHGVSPKRSSMGARRRVAQRIQRRPGGDPSRPDGLRRPSC